MNQLVAGSKVAAIIPTTFEEVWRIAKGVVIAGIAPYALTGGKRDETAISAVSVAIMSGAELGLPPMVALRSFTVINGKPALYGDGLIAVVRRSGKAKRIDTGCVEKDGQLIGFCEATRLDTDETKRVEFTQEQAKQAGLWVRDNPSEKDKKSVWYKYPERMLSWRAAGYCLRDLFADVLGGIIDEFEAAETIETSYKESDIPPSPKEQDETEQFILELEEYINEAESEERIEEIFDEMDVRAVLTHDEDALKRAFDIKNKAIDKLNDR